MRTFVHEFDLRLTKLIQRLPSWVLLYMRVVTFIGRPVFILLAGYGIAMYGLLYGNIAVFAASAWAMMVFGVGAVLKLMIRRDRPATEYVALKKFRTSSFPSGHAVGSVAVFGLATFLLWHYVMQPWGAIIAALLAVIIVSIGISRVYLGAHFPTDVIGGWLLGTLGLAAILITIQSLL